MPPIPSDLRQIAVLLDVDGTLLDIAPTPDQVHVPDRLRQTLAMINDRVDGALALVSGRPLADLDVIFAPLRLAAIGGHGAELRPVASGGAIEGRTKTLDPALKRALNDIVIRHAGSMVEDKGYSIALHHRQMPDRGQDLVREVERACAAAGDPSVELLTGKAVIEVKLAGFDKGTAVRELMAYPPFRGRAPIFIGDDKTDEHAFAVVPDFNGRAISVSRRVAGIEDYFESPAEVRRWLERLADREVVSG